MSEPKTMRNPGWAGETGDFEVLGEDQVRGTDYVGARPLDGGHPGAAPSYPYQIEDRDPEAPLFEGAYRERLDKILSRYPDPQGALLPVLNLAQEVRGHLSAESMDRVAELLELAPAYVRGVATFYTMYNKSPVGRYLIQVCTNVCCNVCGADDVVQRLVEETGAEMGEVSADGLFTVIEAECLGACGFPTVVQINNRYFENVTADEVPAILEHLRTRGVGYPQQEGRRRGSAPTRGAAEHERAERPQPAEGAQGTADPRARSEHPGQGVHREPAVPPTPGGAESGGPAGPRATGGSEAHRPEDAPGAGREPGEES